VGSGMCIGDSATDSARRPVPSTRRGSNRATEKRKANRPIATITDRNITHRVISRLGAVAPADRVFKDVWSVLVTPEGVYFSAYARLFRWSPDSQTVKVWQPAVRFSKAFWVQGALHVVLSKSGLHRLRGDDWEMVPGGDKLEGHWKCVRWLCGGFNPNDPVFSKLNIEAEYRRVAGDIGKRNRLDHSEPLGVPARRRAAEACGVQIISAFNDEEWGRLYDGWELDEHRYREEQRIRWQDALAAVKAKYPLDGSDSANEVQEYEVQELRRRWLKVPQERSWPIWSVS